MYSVAALQRYIKGAEIISSHCRNIEILRYPSVILYKIPIYEKPLYSENEPVGNLLDILREPYEMTAVFEVDKREFYMDVFERVGKTIEMK